METVFLQEWWVYAFIKDARGIGSLKFNRIEWNNRKRTITFLSKDLEMKIKDLILKLQELDPESQVVVVFDTGTVKINQIVLQ